MSVKSVKVRGLAGAALAAAVLVTGAEARAQDPDVPRYPPSSVRPKLIVGGLAITGVAYGAAFLGAEATPTWPGTNELKIPVIGPWWALAQNGCPPEDPGCDAFVYLRASLLVIDGLLQAAGLAIAAEGIFMKTEAVRAAPKPAAAFTWRPSPFVTPSTAGVGFVGTF